MLVVCGLVGFTGCSKKSTPAAGGGTNSNSSTPDGGPKLAAANEKAAEQAAATPTTETPAATANAADDEKHEKLPTAEIVNAAEPAQAEEILLGTADLTHGIPGDGPLTNEQIEKWLADPKNHVPLKPLLPFGLAAGAGQIAEMAANPLTRAKIELGRQLYFDTRLSNDNSVSCASCHSPEFGYAKNTQFGVGTKGQTGKRNSPVAYNRILSSLQFWDGRAATLEEQAKGPIANPIEMSNTHDVCVSCLGGIDGYKLQFASVFSDGVNIDNVAKAIASFERALVTGPSPWDYYEALNSFQNAYKEDLADLESLKTDDPDTYNKFMELKKASGDHPISESAIRGGALFFSEKVGCTACHVGANFTDEKYHNLGVGMDAKEPDLGRYEISKEEKDKGAFKTPTVRNVALTGPYMHDGSQKTLEEVVEWYDKGGHPNQWLDEKVKPLKLTAQEKTDLVEFMKALSGPLPEVEAGRLPE
jgi:cytochrome c peroxidase